MCSFEVWGFRKVCFLGKVESGSLERGGGEWKGSFLCISLYMFFFIFGSRLKGIIFVLRLERIIIFFIYKFLWNVYSVLGNFRF